MSSIPSMILLMCKWQNCVLQVVSNAGHISCSNFAVETSESENFAVETSDNFKSYLILTWSQVNLFSAIVYCNPLFISQVTQLTGFSDPVYAEAYININQYDIVLDVLVVNQTSDTLQNCSLELATLGKWKQWENIFVRVWTILKEK